jgi:NAD(P)-dependent dehydrogenase (short-subunit alcohol dehydrogenase family)
VALVTGAGRGIGRAIAAGLAEDGYDVVVHYHSNREGATATEQLVRGAGRRCLVCNADLASPGGPAALLEAVEEGWARMDVLVNCAGVLLHGSPDDIEDDELQHLMRVNVEAPYALITKGARLMADGGRVVNISSDAANLPRAGATAYAASKAALDSLTRSFAEWLGPRGITVNGVAPGPVATEMLEPMLEDPAVREAFTRSSAQGRLGEPDDVVPLVRFLASRSSGWVNGQTIEATGGRTAW